MIISELSYLEVVSITSNLVGGEEAVTANATTEFVVSGKSTVVASASAEATIIDPTKALEQVAEVLSNIAQV